MPVPAKRQRSAADTLRTRIYTERKTRGWPARKMAEAIRSLADDPGSLPAIHTLIRMIRAWESGKHVPSELYRLLYCKVFTMTEDELFGENSDDDDTGTCRIPVELAAAGYAAEPVPEPVGPVSLVISMSLPYLPGRVVIQFSEPSQNSRDLTGSGNLQEAASGYLTLVPNVTGREES
jgi:hypothetical protein